MKAVNAHTIAPAITICNGLATVLTTNVAGVFQKTHKDVLEAVDNIIQRTPEDRRGNFIPVELERPSNLGKGIVKYKAYALTKAGFTFLAMGFTGEKADRFKWAYIDEFDRMEKALSGESGPDYIDEAQQREIQKAVGRRAAGAPKNFRVIYSRSSLNQLPEPQAGWRQNRKSHRRFTTGSRREYLAPHTSARPNPPGFFMDSKHD